MYEFVYKLRTGILEKHIYENNLHTSELTVMGLRLCLSSTIALFRESSSNTLVLVLLELLEPSVRPSRIKPVNLKQNNVTLSNFRKRRMGRIIKSVATLPITSNSYRNMQRYID